MALTMPTGSSEALFILNVVLIRSLALFASEVAEFKAFAEIKALALEIFIILSFLLTPIFQYSFTHVAPQANFHIFS
jgi:hypothetical protein